MSTTTTFVAADGDGYERLMGRWSRLLALPFVEFAGTAEGERVLDVGCGTGHLAFAVAAATRTSEVVGIDLSTAYVSHATQHNRDPRVAFQIGDACSLPLPDGGFDRVLSLLVLHFVPNATQAITEMRRVARPGAVVAAAVWDVRGGFVANRMFFDTAAALDPRAVERRARNLSRPMTRPGEMKAAWHEAGFEDIEETTLAIRMEFESFDDYWAPYEGRDGPGAEYVATLGTQERTALREAVRAAYLGGDGDGPRSFAAIAWAVKGKVPAGGK